MEFNRWVRGMFLLSLLLPAVAGLAKITLIEAGAARATIIISKEANDQLNTPLTEDPWKIYPAPVKVAAAARDLQRYLLKMTGVTVQVRSDALPVPEGNLILLGRSALTKEFDARIPSGDTPGVDEEGYAIITRGNRLLLAGNDERAYHGTEYAASALLHRLGVRWYMPGEYGDFVPKRTTIVIEDTDAVIKPDFKLRNWWTSGMAQDLVPGEYRWKIRNGMNPTFKLFTPPSDSSVRTVLPPEEQLNDPALSKVWGKLADGRPSPAMPNLTSAESVKYAADKIKAYFRQHPDETSYGIAGDDGVPFDFSPETVKSNMGMTRISGLQGVTGDLNVTDEWMRWTQAVAREVYTEFPDHIITTNGYSNRNDPPLSVVPDPKIWIMFAAIWCDTMHAYDNPLSWQAQRQGKMIEAWARQYKNVFMYNYIYYMLAGCGAPIALSHKTAHDMPLYKKWGVIGFGEEGRVVRGETGVFPTWLRARMMWDADLNVQKERDEFFANWYGPAAKPAMAFWEDLETTFETTPWLGHEDRILPYVYSPALVERLENSVRQAEALATDDTVKAHVLGDRVTLEHLKAYLAMNRAEFDGNFAEAAEEARRMIDCRKPATAVSRWYFDPLPDGSDSYGFYYWGTGARRAYYEKVAAATTGKTGRLIVKLPETARCTLDPHDDGRYEEWFRPGHDTGGWTPVRTTMPFYRQVPGALDKSGFPYMGILWYRLDVTVPENIGNKKVYLYCAAIEPEAWVWINGKYAGHRALRDAYERPNELDLDVTDALAPGKTNSIVIRINTWTNPTQMADGLVSRLLLYAPNDKPLSEQP